MGKKSNENMKSDGAQNTRTPPSEVRGRPLQVGIIRRGTNSRMTLLPNITTRHRYHLKMYTEVGCDHHPRPCIDTTVEASTAW